MELLTKFHKINDDLENIKGKIDGEYNALKYVGYMFYKVLIIFVIYR